MGKFEYVLRSNSQLQKCSSQDKEPSAAGLKRATTVWGGDAAAAAAAKKAKKTKNDDDGFTPAKA